METGAWLPANRALLTSATSKSWADSIMSVIGFIFVFTMLPETKGKSMTLDTLPSTTAQVENAGPSPSKGLYQAID